MHINSHLVQCFGSHEGAEWGPKPWYWYTLCKTRISIMLAKPLALSCHGLNMEGLDVDT